MSRTDNDSAYFKAKNAAKRRAVTTSPELDEWPPIAENARMMIGSPAAEVGPSAPVPAPMPNTRTISAIPAGETEDSVRAELRQKTGQRSAIIRRALTTNDQAEREGLIAERHALENEIRPLGDVLPRSYVTAEGAQRSAMDMRGKLAAARAATPASIPQSGPDAALAAGTAIAGGNRAMTTPMQNPADEMRRREMLRTAARDPSLTGTGMDMEITTPEMQERARRRAMDQQLIAQRAAQRTPEEVFPDVGPSEGAAIESRLADERNRQEGQQPRAATVMADAVRRREFARSMEEKSQKLATANLDREVEGTDTESTERQIRMLDAQNRLAVAKATGQGAVEEAQRTAPTATNVLVKDHVARLEAMLPDITNPGISRAGWGGPEERDATVNTVIGEIERAIPSLSPPQRAEYGNRLRSLMFTLQENTSMFGRGDYREKYVQRLQQILSALDTGAVLAQTPAM